MKNIYTLVLFVITFFNGNAQIVDIPDANFKAKLLAANPSNTIAKDANGQNIKIDVNDDGEIQISEALSVFSLNVSHSYIQNLMGIEEFLNIAFLRCDNNQLSSLDISQNVALVTLYCFHNGLESLDISQNVALKFLHCESNQLTSIDISQNIALLNLDCDFNLLTSIDLSLNNALESLSCTNNQLTSIDISQNTALIYLLLNENQITSLDVSQNTALLGLYCVDNQLTSLDLTQNSALISVDCSINPLTSLNVSQNVDLQKIFCKWNLLTSLDVTQNVALKDLDFSFNQLTSIDVSQNIALRSLGCDSNLITSLDVSQNIALNTLYCSNNQLTSLDISQNIALIMLECNNNQLTSLDVSENIVLYSLECNSNQLTSLDITQNSVLEWLLLSYNQLSSLFIKNNNQYWNYLEFEENPSLQYICADENDITLVQQRISTYGYTNCHVNSYCSFVPNGTFYTIQGNTKFDSNSDGCDASDINMPNQKFTFTSGALNGSLIPDESGDYAYAVQSGTHVITPVLENPNYFIISPTSASVTFPAATSPFTQDFCITANGIKNDLEITIIPIEVARPGFDAHYKIVYKNKGNQVANGTLTFSFDDTVLDLVSSIPSIDGSGTNTLNWNFTNLNPFETREIDLVFNINSPMETPAVNGGDFLVYTATIVVSTDETPNDNTFTLNQTVVNSYDPNDKTCLEGNTITPEMVGQYVHYVIRFENTGTFAAENVVIADVIDTSKFEISSLVPQSSSHDFFTRINGNKVEFIFENINLPFDDENNDGYVAFKIKTKSNLVLGNTFTNKANIYFDYNFPIITNTTSTTVTALSNQDFDFEMNFTLYPNPAKEVLNIKAKTEMDVKSISIYNTIGQIIMTTIHAENGEINVSNLQSGSYFIKVFTDKGSSTAKFIKQ